MILAVLSWNTPAICGLAWEMPLMWLIMAVAHLDRTLVIFRR